ncbi:1-acyl-sn-glycerol-3-phosphate acyltransferase [Cochlodiniinecator piscidefendens]|uniref:1-acyl-sn-glycerol-3-phosphate acyltransferase n=1 Tax=Cochlodiniinecator piscidefendens TaxID=2715756 RepID=UPI001408B21D|nr:1-acyl-sn-glycerol-3-phosphate acyltransferase [Cochlodiniinecator piscidefendens]
MFRIVELPLWALVLILLFASVTALSHFLLPSVRWFFRRRMERVVAKLNERLERPIQPFKLARRHDMIQRLIYDPKVAEAIAEYAAQEGIPENVAFQKAQSYAREIVPSFSATAYFGFAIKVARRVSQMIYRVRIGYYDEAAMKNIDKNATVVFVMNHRSNMDYVLVTYLAAERSALSYAVGEWARVWPLKGFIRSMGAYFIRRRSRNVLYRRVLSRYVQMATAGGVMQAVFPEGGLSLDGRMAQAKLGLLNYIIADYDPHLGRDVVFVPIAINYDRVLEDRVLIEASETGTRKFKFHIFRMLGFIGRQIRFKLTGRYHRFGYAAVSFGEPLSLRSFIGYQQGDPTTRVAKEISKRIKDVIPALPVSLVATVLQRSTIPLTAQDVAQQVEKIASALEEQGRQVHLPRDNPEYAAQVGLRILKLRQFIVEGEAGYSVVPEAAAAVSFYSASIEHLVDANAA